MIESSPFEMRSERQGDRARVSVTGELDIATAPQVQHAVDGILAEGVRDLVVDLRELTFIDSSGLRMLILLNDRAARDGWSLGLVRANRSLSVFEITGAEDNLPFLEEPSAP